MATISELRYNFFPSTAIFIGLKIITAILFAYLLKVKEQNGQQESPILSLPSTEKIIFDLTCHFFDKGTDTEQFACCSIDCSVF